MNEIRKASLNDFLFWNVVLIAFVIPLSRPVCTWLAISLLVLFLFSGGWKEKIGNLRKRWLVHIPVFLFFMHALAMAWTENIPKGWFDMETKLSLLVFPVVLGAMDFSKRDLQLIKRFFIAGCLLLFTVCITKALILFVSTGEYYHFFYKYLANGAHPTYLAWYTGFALIFLFEDLNELPEYFKKGQQYVFWGVSLLFSLFIVMLSSKAGIITLAIILVSVLGFGFYFRLGWGWFFKTSAIGLIVLYFTLNIIPQRFSEPVEVWSQHETVAASTSSSGLRRQVWEASVAVISDNFLLGTGTGDVKDVLVEEYEKRNFSYAAQHRLGSHNQYLQTFAALGILGVIPLILFLTIFLYRAWILPYPFYYFLGLLSAFHAIFEAVLEVQAGVYFYAFWYSLLLYKLPKIIKRREDLTADLKFVPPVK